MNVSFDIIVRDGFIFDGSGNPGFKADLCVKDGKIVKIGRAVLGSADRVIDAEGLVVAPGFIDIHQHSDHTLFSIPKCESFIHQGVTTVGVGNCGLSIAPLSEKYRKEIIRYYESFTFNLDVPYNWYSFDEYLCRLEELNPGVNVWPQIGHCALRATVMGYEGRAATSRELEEMKGLLKSAMEAGTPAFSTGWYAPAYWAETSELIELAKIVSKFGGIFTIHLRRAGFQEAVEVGRGADIPVEVAHYNGEGVPEARAEGLDITYDAYPYNASSSLLGHILPFWVYEGGVDVMLEKISDGKVRDKIRRELKDFEWNKAFIAYLPSRDSEKYVGRSVGEIAESEKADPTDVLCDILLENDGTGLYVYRNRRNEAYVLKTLRDPNQFIMSDGWGFAPYEPYNIGKPHPRCYGAFPRVLGWYVRECEIIPLQEAIRKMTSGPALKMGIKDRGLLREGFWADITIFNPETIIDRATFDDPHRYPMGIEYVILNGQLVIDEGEHTGVRAGKVLRRT